MEREKLGSRLGFILLSAGCAIGLGNVWKFPYITGQNGGGVFVLFYLLFLVILGIPVMTMEFAIGRASQKSPIKMYQPLEKAGQKWHLHGIMCMIGNYILMMFYTSVAGWMLYYVYLSLTGKYFEKGVSSIDIFGQMLSNPYIEVGYMAVIVVVGFLILSMGLQKGLEKITKVMMILLISLILILVVHSLFLEGGHKGLVFYLKPNLARARKAGLMNVAIAAMNQAFFTLSLGIGAMAIFGSYIDKERSLLGESINVAILDTFVAICAGLIIFPACYAYDVPVDNGPSLLFVTLPLVFRNMAGGRIWGSMFFLFMVFAAFSTVLGVFENLIACTMDLFGWSRKKACYMNIVIMFLLSLPCALGFNVLSGFAPMGTGSTFLDLEDFIVSNLMLPVGSIIMVLFCTIKKGWGWDAFLAEANAGEGVKIPSWLKGYSMVILPLIILFVFIMGLI